MPVTLKRSVLKYKNQNGNYIGLDVVTERSTAEQIAQIQAAGEEVQEMLDAAPDLIRHEATDFKRLSADRNMLNINTYTTEIDGETVTVYPWGLSFGDIGYDAAMVLENVKVGDVIAVKPTDDFLAPAWESGSETLNDIYIDLYLEYRYSVEHPMRPTQTYHSGIHIGNLALTHYPTGTKLFEEGRYYLFTVLSEAETNTFAAADAITWHADDESIVNAAKETEKMTYGTVNGVPVPSTDPHYENNAKYYAQLTQEAETTAVQAINTAGTNQVSAVQTKGEEVLDSIPADYTQLSGDVSNLKGALEYKTGDITREMTYIRGENLIRNDSTMKSGYMALDGTVYSNSGLVYSEHIPVLEGDTIKAYNTQEGVFAQKPLRFVTAFNSSGEAVTASGLNNGWIYTVPSGIVEVVVTMVTGTNYMISLESVVTAYKPFTGHYIATEDFLGEVFTNALSQKVDKDGLSQVSSNNIEDLIKTDKHIQSRNLFANATLVAQNQYVAGIGSTSGKAYLLASQGLDTYIIPVDGVSVYSFTNCRTAIVVSDLEYTPVGSLLTYATSINSSGGAYILFSFNPTTYPVTDYSITKPIPVYKAINWEIENGIQKQAVASKSGSIADGGALTIDGRSALKDGQMITFVGTVSSFGVGFELEFWNTSVVTNNIVVDATNISVKYNTSEVVPVAHGLDINNANTVAVTVQFDKGKAKIKLYANGSVYSAEYDWYQTNGTVTQPRVKSNGAVFSDSDLVITYDSANRGIWVFGDSYLSLTSDARWPYYLNADGYADNALMSGSPGCTTYASSTALTALLTYGTPKFAVLATGMNDGSDTNGQAASLWVTYRDAFLALCEAQGITPVFCTIPTVPTVNNETKNAWIRSSGYRYIDFAKAVGANSSGVWYSGMLSGDNVHPTATGAKALYTQVLIDLPEITIHYGLSK